MGWWSPKGKAKITIGDDALSLGSRYFEDLVRCYQEDGPGRPPTLAEIETLLTLALQGLGDQRTVPDLRTQRVKSVSIETERAKPVDPAVGDVLAIPVGKDGYGFGRIVNLGNDWKLIQPLARLAKTASLDDPKAVEPVGFPMFMPPDAFDSKAPWSIVGRDPKYDASWVRGLEFVSGEPPRQWTTRVGEFKPHRRVTREEAAGLPEYVGMLAVDVAKEIRRRAKAASAPKGPKKR